MDHRPIIFIISLLIIHFSTSCEHKTEPESKDLLDSFTGKYLCQITSCLVNTETWEQSCHTLVDTIEVTKVIDDINDEIDNGIRKLQISGLNWGSYNSVNIVDFHVNDSSFINPGQRVYGRFYYDSIYVHTQRTPAKLASGTYVGKRIVN